MAIIENDCTVFTYNYDKKGCHLSDNIDFNTLRNQNEYKNFDKFISSTQNCKSNLITYQPQFTTDKFNLFEICPFKLQQPNTIPSRCPSKYYQVFFTVNTVKRTPNAIH